MIEVSHPAAALRGLAKNTATPDDVAFGLLGIPALAGTVAHNRHNISKEFADAVIALGDDPARWLANNGWTPPDVLRRLSTHPSAEVRAASARNKVPSFLGPGCAAPLDVLTRLAGDPEVVVRDQVATHCLDLPDEVRARLAADPSATVRKTMIHRWAGTSPPPEIVRAWLTDENDEVRATAMRWIHDAPPPDLVEALLADPVTAGETLGFVDLTPELIARFAESDDDRYHLAGHPGLPADIARRLAANDEDGLARAVLLTNEATPEDLRAELSATAGESDDFMYGYWLHNAWLDRKAVPWLRNAPLAKRLEYLDSPYDVFRKIVATGQDLPQWAVERLMADPSPVVRKVTATCHDSVSSAALEELVWEHGEILGVHPPLYAHPRFSRDGFVRFAESTQSRHRFVACQGPDLPAELVAVIATDPEVYVRKAAAGHPNVSAATLRKLLSDEDKTVVEAAAASAALPVPYMHAILDL